MSKTEKPTHKFQIEIYLEDYCAVDSYIKFVQRHVNQGDKIPARVLKKLFTLLNSHKQIQEQRAMVLENSVLALIDTVMNRFKGTKYDFNETVVKSEEDFFHFIAEDITNGMKQPTKKKRNRKAKFVNKEYHYSLEELVVNIFQELFGPFNAREQFKKDDCLRFVYGKVSNYYRLCYGEKLDGKDYQMRVVTAFITQTVGFELTSKKRGSVKDRRFSNSDLYEATRNALGDFKKKAPAKITGTSS